MLITLAKYTKGRQAVSLLENPQTGQIMVMHEDREGQSQFPIMYQDGSIAYDQPGRVCKYARPLIEKAFRAKKALEFARRWPGWHVYDPMEDDVIRDLQAAGKVLIYEPGRQFMKV